MNDNRSIEEEISRGLNHDINQEVFFWETD